MLTLTKMTKLFLAVGCAAVFSSAPAQAGCMPVNPICLFQKILKVTPSMPVFDFTAVPAIIPHVPAALLKEGQTQLKQLGDQTLEKLRSGQLPSLADIKIKMPKMESLMMAASEDYVSLEAFPKTDSEDPMEITKSIEVVFLRPDWNKEKKTFSKTDRLKMNYYSKRFKFENVIETTGYTAYLNNQMETLMAAAEEIQQKVKDADDLNKAQRANFAAQLLEYQLGVIENQLEAVQLQSDAADRLSGGYILEEPVFSNM